MKNTLRQTARAAALACLAGVLGGAGAIAHAGTTYPVTAEQRTMAKKVAQTGVDVSELSSGAPQTYTVKRGDTLWHISGMYLRSPWRWPALWGMNMDEVSNPHLIYPGEVLRLEVVNGKARLTKAPGRSGEVRLSPHVRVDEQMAALSTIPIGAIRPFLTKPLLVDNEAFVNSGVVRAAEENRINVGAGGKVYANGSSVEQAKVGTRFAVYRAGRPIVDPQTSGALGVEAIYLGEAVVERLAGAGQQLTTLRVSGSIQEIGRGDRLVSIPTEFTFQFVPRSPEGEVDAQVVMIHDGRSGASLLNTARPGRVYETEGGPLSIVVLNRGEAAGLQPGHVLRLSRPGHAVTERASLGFRNGDRVPEAVNLPSEAFGAVMVFKTFSGVSYAIVLDAGSSVMPGDLAESPAAKLR